eukprot:2091286-Prymnesium_polylepis.1
MLSAATLSRPARRLLPRMANAEHVVDGPPRDTRLSALHVDQEHDSTLMLERAVKERSTFGVTIARNHVRDRFHRVIRDNTGVSA